MTNQTLIEYVDFFNVFRSCPTCSRPFKTMNGFRLHMVQYHAIDLERMLREELENANKEHEPTGECD